MDSRGGYVSKILYVKTKESGPLGGGVRRASANVDPPMVWMELIHLQTMFFQLNCYDQIWHSFLESKRPISDF